ncbi:hypothetical protein NE237_022368 [Protea cynaroides]|uniref:Uncharacterized protein n=1 Tax=Protea cynaroides TaxID=273540 RepID=A0A9Q0HAW8_9MAGN|nr:hypothetical protein NE237_022368 [Protea cynaroides]
MDTLQLQKKREKAAEKEAKEREKQEVKEGQPTKQQQSPTSSSPPSASSSPSHEFSFTISLHPSSTTPDKSTSPLSFAVDLSPADDIFFHGHLLPLHLLSHLPISPRSSINSFDSFSIPISELLEDSEPNINTTSITTTTTSTSTSTSTTTKTKPKSFSLFGFTRWHKGGELREREDYEVDEEDGHDKKKKKKRKIRSDVRHILKRYTRMVRALLLFRSGRKESRQFIKQPHSFSVALFMHLRYFLPTQTTVQWKNCRMQSKLQLLTNLKPTAEEEINNVRAAVVAVRRAKLVSETRFQKGIG